MAKFPVTVFFTAFFLLLLQTGVCEEKIILTAESDSIQLKYKIYLLEDPDGKLSVQEAAKKAADFSLNPEKEPNIGFTRSDYWAMLIVENRSGHDKWMLELGYPPFDYIEAFIVSGRGQDFRILHREKSGDQVPKSEKLTPNRTHTVKLPVPPGSSTRVFLQLSTESSFVLPLRILTEEGFYSNAKKALLLFGILFGFYLVMVLYHIPLFFTSRERSYLYYTVFVTVYLLFQASMSGIAGLYLWPGRPWWINRSMLLFGSLSIFFTLMFTRQFLQTPLLAPGINKIFTGLLIVTGATVAASFCIPYFIGIQAINYMMSLVGVLYIVSAVWTYRKGFKPARYYLIAWISFIIAVFLIALKNGGLLPSTPVTANVLYIGGGLEIVLLSIALGDKINLLTKQHEQSEKDKLNLKEEMLRATEKQLYTDSLTGLASRNKLIADLSTFNYPVLLLINIDHFKDINNFYGNKIGDSLILLLGKRLGSLQPLHAAHLYRLHADEFAFAIDDSIDDAGITVLAEEMYSRCQKEPYGIGTLSIHIEVSIGAAALCSNILEKADIALSKSKQTQSNFCIYNPSMQTMKQYENNLKWIEFIKDAIAKDRVFPVFQPIYSNVSGKIEKYETLIRLELEDKTVVSPGAFLRIAKEAKLYPVLSRIVIDKSLQILKQRGTVFTVNLSIDDIQNEETVTFLKKRIEEYDFSNKLVFEILESEGIGNYEAVSSFIDTMNRFGIQFAIDDFGSGYSNFEYLLRLKIDYIKIDSSLIKDIHRDIHARHVVETIIAICRKLQYKTVAEFVHNKEVYDVVRQLNIDYSQGFYLSEPLQLD